MELTLKRFAETKTSTASTLWHGNKFLCFTIEDGHNEPKIKGKTRIPAGRYELKKATDTRFNKEYKKLLNMDWVIRVLNVPNFEGIEIHIGNTAQDTNGCILPNSLIRHGEVDDYFFGGDSRGALIDLYHYLNPITEPIFLTITDPK